MTAAIANGDRLIEATMPPEHRGIARDAVHLLFTDRQSRTHRHARFHTLPALLRSGDLLVVNDSATLPAALTARRANGEPLALHVATALDARIVLTEPRSSVLVGEELRLPDGGSAVMIAPVEPAHPRLWYAWYQTPQPMREYLMAVGEPIRYGYVRERFPLSDYQTAFAREPGSAEMPSAARPFTSRVVRALRCRGIGLETITLHCGVSSFEAPERPAMERFRVSRRTADAVNRAKSERRRVIAVGTTVLRALESAVYDGELTTASGWTDLVIDRAHRIASVDGLLTGFHDSAATHQWILDALLDDDLLAGAYAQAAERGYRSHEFGDVHLIL